LIVNVVLAWPLAIEGDEREPPAIGYYRTHVVRGRDLGDAHTLYFCLHKDDLLNRRFERSWAVEQCC